MKKVVSFSGGRTSAYLCKLMVDKFGKDNVDVVYMDTGFEHPATYDFILDCDKRFALQVTYLRGDFSKPLGVGVGYNTVNRYNTGCDGKPFSEMMSKYGAPYIGGMFCTDRMKLTPFKKYCNDVYGKNNYEVWLGIRSDEPKRYLGEKTVRSLCDYENEDFSELFRTLLLNNGEVHGDFDIFNGMWTDENNFELDDKKKFVEKIIQSDHNNKTRGNIHYMVEISNYTKEDILKWWSKMPFDLAIPEWLGNCVFCPKKSNLKLAAAQRDEPELYTEWLDMLYADSVRVDDKTGHWSKMYRGNQSLESLITTFDGSTGAEIKARIRGGHHVDTNSCSESCEVFQ